jgi:hypothetical protein
MWDNSGMAEESTSPNRNKFVNWLPLATFGVVAIWVPASRILAVPHPPVGMYIGVLAFVAAIVTIWPPERPWSKALWILVFGALLVLEITTLYQQRHDDEVTTDTNRKDENDRLAKILDQNQADFAATMSGMESVLSKQDKTLLQTMGGPAFPLFLPVYPAVSSPSGVVLPVNVINSVNTRGAPQRPLPLVDVSVDISIVPRNENIREAANSMLHSPHYNLGTILPGMFVTTIQLQPGRSYDLMITTRRGFFREMINIESEQMNWCMYQRIERAGKMEERLVDRADGKPLTEPCN